MGQFHEKQKIKKQQSFVDNEVQINKRIRIKINKDNAIPFQKDHNQSICNEWAYYGELINNLPDGQGTAYCVVCSSECYVGGFKNGKFDGKGTLKNPDDEIYVGEFKDGKYYGKGKLEYYNGNMYEGEWEEGLRHGYGKMYYNYKKILLTIPQNIYEGYFENGLMHGKGTYISQLDTLRDVRQYEIVTTKVSKKDAQENIQYVFYPKHRFITIGEWEHGITKNVTKKIDENYYL